VRSVRSLPRSPALLRPHWRTAGLRGTEDLVDRVTRTRPRPLSGTENVTVGHDRRQQRVKAQSRPEQIIYAAFIPSRENWGSGEIEAKGQIQQQDVFPAQCEWGLAAVI